MQEKQPSGTGTRFLDAFAEGVESSTRGPSESSESQPLSAIYPSPPDKPSWLNSFAPALCGPARLIPPLIPYLNSTTPVPIGNITITFPLSPDHHLLTLAQYNVLRATFTNMKILSVLDSLPHECAAAMQILALLPGPEPGSTLPESLTPTLVQKTIPHESWIDSVPFAPMRDNLILLRGTYNGDDLCSDLCGGLYDGFDDVELKGVLVWSDPWRAESWELTEGFAKKWKPLLRGCGKFMESTNRWRARRGEDRLVFEIE